MHHFEDDIEAQIQAIQSITIEDAIVEAIISHRMTEEEGNACIEAYYKYFNAE